MAECINDKSAFNVVRAGQCETSRIFLASSNTDTVHCAGLVSGVWGREGRNNYQGDRFSCPKGYSGSCLYLVSPDTDSWQSGYMVMDTALAFSAHECFLLL